MEEDRIRNMNKKQQTQRSVYCINNIIRLALLMHKRGV